MTSGQPATIKPLDQQVAELRTALLEVVTALGAALPQTPSLITALSAAATNATVIEAADPPVDGVGGSR